MDPSAAQPAHRTRAILVRHRRCRVQHGRWCDRTGASGPVGRPCDGGLRGFAIAPRPRHRDQRVEDTDPVRLDHPRPVSSRAIYRALEHQLHPRRGSGRIPARGPAPQPPGDRRHPATCCSMRQRDLDRCIELGYPASAASPRIAPPVVHDQQDNQRHQQPEGDR